MKNKYENAVFLSDLDGTLLNSDAELPEGAVRGLRELMSEGVKITFATARTVRSVKYILKEVLPTLPVALMNGVLLCDMSGEKERYVHAEYLGEESFIKARAALDSCGICPFMYSLDGDELVTSYTEIANDYSEHFMRERIEKYNKPFTRINKDEKPRGKAIYFAAMDTEERVRRAAAECGGIDGTAVTFYRDSYVRDVWYLEIFSERASKKHAAELIKKLSGADRLVAFGDNFNDIPMFEAADECCAVETAPDEVKARADMVIPCADRCGVPETIRKLITDGGELFGKSHGNRAIDHKI